MSGIVEQPAAPEPVIQGADADGFTDSMPTPEPVEQPEPISDGGASSPAEPPQTETQPPEPEKPSRKPWHQTRIDQLYREAQDAKRIAAGLEARLKQFEQAQNQPAEGDPAKPLGGLSPEDIDRLVEAKTTERLRQEAESARMRELNAAANRTFEAGSKEFPDFVQARDTLVQNFGEQLSQRPDFLEAITELPNGHAVFRHLGQNPDDAAHVLSLPPVRMAVELAKLGTNIAPKRNVSQAPAPVQPVAGNTRAEPNQSEMSDEQWWAWEAKRLRAKSGRA